MTPALVLSWEECTTFIFIPYSHSSLLFYFFLFLPSFIGEAAPISCFKDLTVFIRYSHISLLFLFFLFSLFCAPAWEKEGVKTYLK
jgi:hypothetical protein